MTVLVHPRVGQVAKACGVHFERTAVEACAAKVESVQTSFGQDVGIEETRQAATAEFAKAIKNVYGVMDMVHVAKQAGVFDKLPGASAKPEEVIAGIVAAFCSTVRFGAETKFHYDTAALREIANRTVHGRVCLFAAESYSSTIRYKGYFSPYVGTPFDVYESIMKWFYKEA